MLSHLCPIEFIQQAPTGKTRPAFMLCEDKDRAEVAVIAKLSAGSERGAAGQEALLGAPNVCGVAAIEDALHTLPQFGRDQGFVRALDPLPSRSNSPV